MSDFSTIAREALVTELGGLRKTSAADKSRIEELEKLLAHAKEASRELDRKLGNARQSGERFKQRSIERNTEVARLETELKRSDERGRDLQQELRSTQTQLATQQAATRAAEQALGAARAALSDDTRSRAEISALQSALAAAQADLDKQFAARLEARQKLAELYDSRWNRLGGVLRSVKQRPVRVVRLPLDLARALRPGSTETTALAKPAVVRSTAGKSVAKRPSAKKRKQPKDTPDVARDWSGRGARSGLRVLSVLDEFSEACLAPEVGLVRASRSGFVGELGGVDLLLVETAWRGNSGEWVYQFSKFGPERELAGLFGEARAQGVPSVLWNKEDPPSFDVFLPVARGVDAVLTTDADCVDRYRAELGHDRVATMMFGAQPAIHNPVGRVGGGSDEVFFGGAWRGHKFARRVDELAVLLDASVECGALSIFDRDPSRRGEGEGFPERYHRFIRGSLSYDQMLEQYRKPALFLNTNSVNGSPTMLARRVFEILACGTPVVSTPSLAMDEVFGDVVATPGSSGDAVDVIGRLVSDRVWRDRVGHVGYRFVHSGHTYQHRLHQAFEELGLPGVDAPVDPLVDVISVTNRPGQLDRVLENFRCQVYGNARLTVVCHGDGFDVEALRGRLGEFAGAQVLEVGAGRSLGDCLNAAVAATEGEFFAKFDDDDWYGPHYVSDMVLATRFAAASVYGKRTAYFYLEELDRTVLRYPGEEHRFTKYVLGATLFVRRADVRSIPFRSVERGTDSRFLEDCRESGLRVYAADRFNFRVWRGASLADHTWQISAQDIESRTDVVGAGLQDERIFI